MAKMMGGIPRFGLRTCLKCLKPIVSYHTFQEIQMIAQGTTSFRLCAECLAKLGMDVPLARKRTLVREDN
jgi:hypothetical protein